MLAGLPKLMVFCSGIVLIGLGMLMFPLPIPAGAPLVIAGLTLVISSSTRAARTLAWSRSKSIYLDRSIRFLEHRAPRRFALILRRTRAGSL